MPIGMAAALYINTRQDHSQQKVPEVLHKASNLPVMAKRCISCRSLRKEPLLWDSTGILEFLNDSSMIDSGIADDDSSTDYKPLIVLSHRTH